MTLYLMSSVSREPYSLEIFNEAFEQAAIESKLQSVFFHLSAQFEKVLRVNDIKFELEEKIRKLEKRLDRESNKLVELENHRTELKKLKEVMQTNNAMQLPKTGSDRSRRSSETETDPKRRWELFKKDMPLYDKYQLTQETIDYLKQPTFNIWHWEPNEMLSLLEHMFQELKIIDELLVSPITLRKFLLCVQTNYRLNPFHNFQHCFCVAQMMYGMIHQLNLIDVLSTLDQAILLTAAICHDLDHPGFNNAYQINARTELAIRYNDKSPLENHHCAVAFQILSIPECNIFSSLSNESFHYVRKQLVDLILATDMAAHKTLLDSFMGNINETFNFKDEKHLQNLKLILIKCCDISNEVRPMEVSDPWVDCLLTEYFQQSDREKELGLPVAPFMDRDKVTKPDAQIGFIQFVLLPMFETLGKLFPQIEINIIQPLREAKARYENLKKIEEDRKNADGKD
ncbi:hypothetical protein SNEBB_005626 [Seison nebaliae]|nr:hypothetical protein SNEBB_005626 [Seison nebaliae]